MLNHSKYIRNINSYSIPFLSIQLYLYTKFILGSLEVQFLDLGKTSFHSADANLKWMQVDQI